MEKKVTSSLAFPNLWGYAAAGCRAELIERSKLPQRDLRRKLRQYSTGMKRKLGIVQAFEGDPPLLILDMGGVRLFAFFAGKIIWPIGKPGS